MNQYKKYTYCTYAFLFLSIVCLQACESLNNTELQTTDTYASVTSDVNFVRDTNFLSKEPNLRKWDAPVVADLDQDGYVDLMLNDHGFSVKIIWNNKGAFAQAYDLIMGDMHGISVGDYDKDGLNEVIIARGGGSGSNARNSVIFRIGKNRSIQKVADFDEPLAFMRGRTVKFVDLNKNGNLDLINFAFPAKESAGKSENYIYENTLAGEYSDEPSTNQAFALNGVLPPSFSDGQKILLSDYNQDGYVDLFMYGHKHLKLYKGGADFSYEDVSDTILPNKIEHVSSALEFDYDNDGDLDILLTRGSDFEAGQTFFNAEKNLMAFYTKRGKFDFLLKDVGDVLSIKNMQSQWPYKKVFIGESGYDYEFPGETHSGRDIRIVNSDALGFPDDRPKEGTYIGYIGNGDWRIAGNMWSPFTAIIEGVPSNKTSAIEEGPSIILLENVDGKLVDKTALAKLTTLQHSTGAVSSDINNDGYQDLVIVPRGNLVSPISLIVFINKQDGTFEKITNHGLVSTELGAIGLGIEKLDLNNDGATDLLIGNERGKWHLFINKPASIPSTSKSIVVNIGSSKVENVSFLGAKVELESCGNRQTKIVGSSSAAYSLSANPNIHFGLGTCQDSVNVKVTWSNGEFTSVSVPASSKLLEIGA